ncbi:TetR family transcriptional regulator [Amycolatopsis sp. K13G38]|uniref:TetR family transcriptional regulator n=1 Tax=Amycolatopsis acididurans TaxID=2724524 RepID=A0ABX1J0A1_9PSEU|nr:TetR family transcriptional regulator [Amycolatopsis acididurans]NKQ53198.1 TetR family transcriptional regulator [Amycolatopsis acididurans]
MPRPTQPLLDRDRVITKALEIIDAEGLAACSLPRLAREFNVKAPSFYHHFADRAEIMAGVARRIVLEAPVPRKRDPEQWIDWLVAQAVSFRRVILRHPNAASILLEFVPRDVLSPRYNDAAGFLQKAGVPAHTHVMILDGLENLTLGAALTQAMKPENARARIFPHLAPDDEPALADAVRQNSWRTAEKLFAQSVRSFLEGAAAS